jgi:hypothetical protein
MDWNEAAEDLEGEGNARINTNTVVEAWIRSTPPALRSELARQMERLGLDPDDYSALSVE